MEEKSNIGWIVVAIVAIVGLVLLFKGSVTGNFVDAPSPSLDDCFAVFLQNGGSVCSCKLNTGSIYAQQIQIRVQPNEFGDCPLDGTKLSTWYAGYAQA